MDYASEYLERLVDELRELPHLEVERRFQMPEDDQAEDLLLRLRGKGQTAKLAVSFKLHGYPKAVAEAARQLRSRKRRTLSMVAAPSLSPTARELLREQGVAYWDSGGSLYLELPWGLYFVDRPPPPPARERREPQHLYRGKTAQVLHALLFEPGRAWKGHELAQAAGVSPYTVHQVLTILEAQLWVKRKGKGPHMERTLIQPGKLLDAWAAEHSLSEYKVRRFHRLAANQAAQEAALFGFLEHLQIEWALTLEHGAERVAPFLTSLPGAMAVLVPQAMPWEKLGRAAGFRPVEEGENFLFLTTAHAGPLMGRQQVENAWVASPIQLYLDLMASPRRGKEQAAQLRSQLLSF